MSLFLQNNSREVSVNKIDLNLEALLIIKSKNSREKLSKRSFFKELVGHYERLLLQSSLNLRKKILGDQIDVLIDCFIRNALKLLLTVEQIVKLDTYRPWLQCELHFIYAYVIDAVSWVQIAGEFEVNLQVLWKNSFGYLTPLARANRSHLSSRRHRLCLAASRIPNSS
jgi:hypothetical protein